MKFNIFGGKSKRSVIFALISVISVILLVVSNFVFSVFVPLKSIYIDMTREGLYTLSEPMKKECDFVEKLSDDIVITFCNDRDKLTEDISTRVVYFMSLQLAERYPDKIKVKVVNGTLNPTALAQYKTTSLSEIRPNDVIVSYGDRYRVINARKFWTVGGDGALWSYNGEYRMASIFRSITAINQPTAYFVTDLSEEGVGYYDPSAPESEESLKYAYFRDLLAERGLTVKLLKLSEVDQVPEDCALLIINNPTKDFVPNPEDYDRLDYVSETEKLDRYLVKNQGAIMVNKDYSVELPVLERFLSEWGISFGTTLLKDAEASLADELGTNTNLIASYDTDEESYGYAIYSDFASVSSAPRTIFSNTGYVKCSFKESEATPESGTANTRRQYASFLKSSLAAKPYAKNSLTGEYVDLAGEAGAYDLAAVVARAKLDDVKNETTYSYIFCSATADFLTNGLLGNSSYANYDVLSALIENISRLDDYASMELGGLSLNSSSYGGKQIIYSALSDKAEDIYSGDGKEIIEHNKAINGGFTVTVTVIVFAIPVLVLILGVFVCLRRRYL